jgi:hypothetical protein
MIYQPLTSLDCRPTCCLTSSLGSQPGHSSTADQLHHGWRISWSLNLANAQKVPKDCDKILRMRTRVCCLINQLINWCMRRRFPAGLISWLSADMCKKVCHVYCNFAHILIFHHVHILQTVQHNWKIFARPNLWKIQLFNNTMFKFIVLLYINSIILKSEKNLYTYFGIPVRTQCWAPWW